MLPLLTSGAMSVIRFAAPAVAAVVLALSLAGCGDAGRPRATIALVDCRIPKLPLAAECGSLEVPENRDRPDGRKISLFVAVLRANTLHPRADPLFILAGGPGQAASFLGPFAAALTGVRKDRDIVLVDQRGTGRSSPLLCAAFKPDHSLKAALEFDPLPKAAACAQELAARGVDAGQYTTAAWVADLDAVRAALDYDRINLWGGSYGTRAAQEYLRRYPQRVRSVVLDGVATPAMRSTLDVWPSREAALAAILDACAQSAACAAAHPDLKATLDAIRDSLGPDGREAMLVDPRTGDAQSMRLTFEHVIGALQPFTYAPELAALLPEVIARAGAGDFAPLYSGAMLVTSDLDEQSNTALHYSVTCTEDVARVTAADAASALSSLRTKTLAERALSVCTAWPKGVAPADATTPVRSEVPVLILSGGLDPVTPPANGAEVAKALPKSRHIVASGYGHIVSPHACGPRLIASFVDDPSFESLPASCVEHFEKSRRPPVWPDRLGARS
jgi:pimeloyl-ACP methyl ester carboxylesterase